MKAALALLVAVILCAGAESAPGQPKGMSLGIQTCTAPGVCTNENTGLVTDWYLTCTDPRNCYNNPTDYGQFGITITNGNRLNLNYSPTGGSRSYLTSAPNADTYRMFYLLNKELSFEVDVSACGCGMNSALYFVSMPADGNKAAGYTGAQYGTGYCDAQPAQVDRPACDEMDIWEANSLTSVFTTHPCNGNSCDAWGCSFNPYSRGARNFYGRGAGYTVDSSRPHTVVTQFVTEDGTDNGQLREIRRFYVQDGNRFDLPFFNGFNSLSDAFCQAFGIPSSQGGPASTSQMTNGLRNGMVLAFSLWGNPFDGSQMSWMDNEPNGPCPVYQNPTPSTSFGNIKIGPIGSTY